MGLSYVWLARGAEGLMVEKMEMFSWKFMFKIQMLAHCLMKIEKL